MLCVCKDRPVLCEVWDSAFDGIDLFSGDTLFFTESVGEDTRKLTLSLVNPGQVPITELTLSDFMVGVVTDVQYENGYYESTQIFQNVDGQSVRNIIFPGQRFDLSMVFDDELGEDREKPGYLYVSFAASALCVEGEEPARYRYDLFCDRQEARGESAPFYTGSLPDLRAPPELKNPERAGGKRPPVLFRASVFAPAQLLSGGLRGKDPFVCDDPQRQLLPAHQVGHRLHGLRPSSGLHSTTQLSLPSSSALTASSVPSTEMIFTSRPGWMPAASSASTAPSAMSSLWE